MQNIDTLDLRLLQVFDAVIQERSISRAAKRLNLAQPTVSNALGRLRLAVGDQLFVRTGRGMEPTPLAVRMAEPIRQSISLIKSVFIQAESFDPTESTRNFTLYLTDLGEAFFLPKLLAFTRKSAPNVKFTTLPMPDVNPQSALERGEVDLAIGNLPDFQSGFYQQRLFREHYICLVRKSHPRVNKTFTVKQFQNAAHAIVLPYGTGHGIVEQTLIKHGMKDQIALRAQNFLALPAIIENTDMVMIAPHSVASQFSTERQLSLIKPPIALPEFDIKQCWHERSHNDGGNKWLRNTIAALFIQA